MSHLHSLWHYVMETSQNDRKVRAILHPVTCVRAVTHMVGIFGLLFTTHSSINGIHTTEQKINVYSMKSPQKPMVRIYC